MKLIGLGMPADYRLARAAWEREWLAIVLERYNGSVAKAADAAGLDRQTFYRKMRRLDVRRVTIIRIGR